MQHTSPADEPEFICPQCGLELLEPVRHHKPHDLDRCGHSTQSLHSSDTGESDVDPSDGRVRRKAPIGYFTHGHRIVPLTHSNLITDHDSDDSEMRHEREQARTEECSCILPVYGDWSGFFKIGMRSSCSHCSSTIEAGVLYGGYEQETDRFYWKELSFHHYAGECGLPGHFPGRTSRQWLAAIDDPIFKTPGDIEHRAYRQMQKHCGATADYMLHRWRLGLSGHLICGKPTISTLLRKAPVA